MAQSITLMNATYNDVPAVDLPKTGGGTARFYDVTDTTATANEVLRGYVFHGASGVLITGACRYNADVSNTTATASDVSSGKYYYNSSGVRTVGTNTYNADTSDTTATSDDVAMGKVFYNSSGLRTYGSNSYNADTSDTTATASDVAEGKYFYDSSGVRRVGTMSAGPYSFIGMVVQGTNLSTQASVQAIYGSNTTWQLISSVSLASENIVGNGYTLGLTEGTALGGMRARGDNAAPSLYGEPVGSTNITGTMNGSVGIPTKSQLGNTPQYSGIIADTVQVYSWERTA